jgi:hypothetical protein
MRLVRSAAIAGQPSITPFGSVKRHLLNRSGVRAAFKTSFARAILVERDSRLLKTVLPKVCQVCQFRSFCFCFRSFSTSHGVIRFFQWVGMVFKHIPKTTDKMRLGSPLGVGGPSARVWKELALDRHENNQLGREMCMETTILCNSARLPNHSPLPPGEGGLANAQFVGDRAAALSLAVALDDLGHELLFPPPLGGQAWVRGFHSYGPFWL